MKRLWKIMLFVSMAALLAVVIVGCAQKKEAKQATKEPTDKQVVMKFSHVVSPETTKGKAIQYFADLVEKYTNGRAKVQVFPSGQLYGDKEEVEAIMAGNVELIAPACLKLVTLEPGYNIWSLLFLFPDNETMRKFVEDPQGWGRVSRKFEESKGLLELGFLPSGQLQWFNTKRPINAPEDLKGLKMRTIGGAVVNEQMTALGGSSVTLPFGEVYNALQLGTVDGGETNIGNIYTMKFYEVTKYLTLSNHASGGYPILINKKFYDKLAPDIQDALKRAGKEAQQYAFEIDAKTDKEMLEKIKASGKVQVNELTLEQRQAFEKKVQPVWEKYKKTIGEDVYQRAMELRKKEK